MPPLHPRYLLVANLLFTWGIKLCLEKDQVKIQVRIKPDRRNQKSHRNVHINQIGSNKQPLTS